MRGQHMEPITDDLKDKFLDLVASGFTRQEAAEALGASARQFRSLCSTKSHRYDEEFARQYAKLTEKDGEHETALAERLESVGIQRALRSSDRLLEKYSAIYDPRWAIHRPQAMQLNFVKNDIEVIFKELPTDLLEQVVAELQQKERALLEQADIVDAE